MRPSDLSHLAALLAAIVDSSDDAIISKELDGTITTWNAGAERLYGYTADEAVGENIALIVPQNRLIELSDVLARIGRGERIEPHETQRLRKDGVVLDISVTISPILSATGKVVGASAIGRDITERLALQRDRQLFDSRLHQSERLESLGRLAGGIAHDFNNLLGVILNYAAFLETELTGHDAACADLAQIRIAAEHGAALIRQLLAFGRQEVLHTEVVNLNDLISGLEALLRRTIGDHIELTADLSPDLWSVSVDPSKLGQVLVNLAVNARDAMPNGGRINVDTSNMDIDEGYAETHPGLSAGRYVRLRVSDTGVGMKQALLQHIFEPFFTTKAHGAGTGLGLPTVFGIVTQAGGEIQLYSEPEMGTTCRVLLPAVHQPPTVGTLAAEPTDLRGDETVLLVEDEAPLREAAQRILVRNGYVVLTAANGAEALAVAQGHDDRIDLLLTDVIMPQMLGNELAAQLEELYPGLPVLLMSGYAEPMLGDTLGQDIILLEKPFSERMLLVAVRSALGKRRAN